MDMEIGNLEIRLLSCIEQYTVVGEGNAKENIRFRLEEDYRFYHDVSQLYPNVLMPNYWRIAEFMGSISDEWKKVYEAERKQSE